MLIQVPTEYNEPEEVAFLLNDCVNIGVVNPLGSKAPYMLVSSDVEYIIQVSYKNFFKIAFKFLLHWMFKYQFGRKSPKTTIESLFDASPLSEYDAHRYEQSE